MALQFRDITDWTPASISIVDKPSHPLAVFEVYENDDEYIKKYINDPMEDETMTGNNPTVNDDITVSKSFFETMLERLVGKSQPEPPADNNSGDDMNKEILEKLNNIEENQKKTDERLTALENPVPADPEPSNNTNDDEGNDGDEGDNGSDESNTTVELPLNSDGTLNLEDAAVAKYLPRNYTPTSQGVDPDLQRGTVPDKSFNERSGRDSNGMGW